MSGFVILKPGEAYDVADFRGRVNLPVNDGSSHSNDYLAPGVHYLLVRMPTWSGTDTLAAQLRKRWEPSGYLWTKPVTSLPMPFTVNKDRLVAKCN